MPANFTESERVRIRKELIENGFLLSREVGMKKMTVALVAERTKIATGTFYHFFKSKEEFVLALIKEMEVNNQADLLLLLNGRERLSLEEAVRWYRGIFTPEKNFLLELKPGDFLWMKQHLPEGFYFDPGQDKEKAKGLLAMIDGVRSDADIGVVVNFFKTIYAMFENRETLCQESIKTNVDLIFDTILRYLKNDADLMQK